MTHTPFDGWSSAQDQKYIQQFIVHMRKCVTVSPLYILILDRWILHTVTYSLDRLETYAHSHNKTCARRPGRSVVADCDNKCRSNGKHTHTNTGIWHSRHIRPSYMFLLISRNVLKQKNRHTFLVREENAYRHRPRVFDVNSVCSMIKCIEYNAWLHSTRVAQKLTMSNNVGISKLIA